MSQTQACTPSGTLPATGSLPDCSGPATPFPGALFHLVPVSSNIKTGPIPVSTSTRETCPPSCPFYSRGCYAAGGPLGIHWRKVSGGTRGVSWAGFLAAVARLRPGQLWRHNQAGDLPGAGDSIDTEALAQLVQANRSKRGFTYTHKPCLGDSNQGTANRAAVRFANGHGFTINLSANSLGHADTLTALDAGPVVAVVPSDFPDRGVTPAGRRVVVCPAQRIPGMSCDRCRLCSLADRPFIVGFRPHGSGRKAVDSIARTNNPAA